MLDAFIIQRIRQEREKRDSVLVPLHIEVPEPEETEGPPEDDESDERGTVIVDNRLPS